MDLMGDDHFPELKDNDDVMPVVAEDEELTWLNNIYIQLDTSRHLSAAVDCPVCLPISAVTVLIFISETQVYSA